MRTTSGPWVVTGAGMATAAGNTPGALLDALVRGEPLASYREQDGFAAAAMESFDAKQTLQRKGVKDLSRISQLACVAAAGVADALRGLPAEEVGVVFGTAWGSLTTVIEFERQAHVQGPRFVDPILFTETVSNVPAGQVAIFHGWSAFNATISTGSASGVASLARALDLLAEGRGSVAVAGGGDELGLPLLRALRGRGVVASRAESLPLALGRSGRVPGEAACFLTLESETHARRREAPAWATIHASAARFSPPGAGSMAPLIRELLDRAERSAGDLDVVVLSASGDDAGDLEEASALLEVFGAQPPVVLPKAILGETWGASGALAAVLAIEMIRSARIPGAPRGFVLDPRAAGLHIPLETLHRPVRTALVLDRTESGHQLGLVLSGERSE